MTESSTHPAGLLTDEEAEQLTNPEAPRDTCTEVRQRIRERVTATLRDFSVLYPMLPTTDIEAAFNPEDQHDLSAIRAATQDALAFLILGMLHNDDMLELRVRDAIRNAGLGYDEEIDVALELRRTPLPTVEEFAARHSSDEWSERILSLYEYFLWNPDTDLTILQDIGAELDMELTSEEKAEMRAARDTFQRPPQTAVTNISIDDQSADDSNQR